MKVCPCLYVFINQCFRVKTLTLDDVEKYEHGASSVREYVADTILSREDCVDESIGELLG